MSRAISLVENGAPGFERLLALVHERVGRAHRVGITGPPGVGKSTLVQGLVRLWRGEKGRERAREGEKGEKGEKGRTVAVVAVDPTSARTGGALLGDRIRMEGVALDQRVYIRSMATRGAEGGLALATVEVCDLLDAAGYGRIVVETVGVGQAELDVVEATDTTVLVLVPESGDGIQALKSGLMEAADIFVVNKADRPGADRFRADLEVALHIRRGTAYSALKRTVREQATWEPPVLDTVATQAQGVEVLCDAIERHRTWLESTGELEQRRAARRVSRAREVVARALSRQAWTLAGAERLLATRRDGLAAGRVTSYEVAEEIAGRLGPIAPGQSSSSD